MKSWYYLWHLRHCQQVKVMVVKPKLSQNVKTRKFTNILETQTGLEFDPGTIKRF